MAAALTESYTREQTECGCCYENDDLRRLPCNPTHIFCITCITKDSAETLIVKCPLCREVQNCGVDDLILANAPLEREQCCDECLKSDEYLMAKLYCVDCQIKLCQQHMKDHNTASDADDHNMTITMDEYRQEYKRKETRYCTEHTADSYSSTCDRCHQVFCSQCQLLSTSCQNELAHRIQPLEVFIAQMTEMMNEKKVLVFEKEEHLLGMSKQLATLISDWDPETEYMIKELHSVKDRQIREITAKYEELEKQLMQQRQLAKQEMISFLDDKVGAELSKLSRQSARLEARLSSYHKVDLAVSHKETEKSLRELMKLSRPRYQISSNHIELVKQDFGLPLYAALKQCENPVPVRYPSGMPMTMRHIKTVEWKDYPHSISHYRDITYLGTQVSKVIALDRRTGNESVFVTIESRKPAPSTPWKPYSLFEVRRRPTRPNTTDRESDWGTSVTVHNDLVYILINKKSGNHSVQVRDLTGKFIRKWIHHGHKDGYSKLRVVGDQLIILNNEDNTIAVYTLDGKLVKKLPYPHMRNSWTSLAACGDNSIIISDYLTGVISRVDLDIDEIIWTSTHVQNPEGVVCYKNRFVLVTNRTSDARIYILDIDSGEYLYEMSGHGTLYESVSAYDLDVDDDVIIIPRYCFPYYATIQYYQLLTQ